MSKGGGGVLNFEIDKARLREPLKPKGVLPNSPLEDNRIIQGKGNDSLPVGSLRVGNLLRGISPTAYHHPHLDFLNQGVFDQIFVDL